MVLKRGEYSQNKFSGGGSSGSGETITYEKAVSEGTIGRYTRGQSPETWSKEQKKTTTFKKAPPTQYGGSKVKAAKRVMETGKPEVIVTGTPGSRRAELITKTVKKSSLKRAPVGDIASMTAGQAVAIGAAGTQERYRDVYRYGDPEARFSDYEPPEGAKPSARASMIFSNIDLTGYKQTKQYGPIYDEKGQLMGYTREQEFEQKLAEQRQEPAPLTGTQKIEQKIEAGARKILGAVRPAAEKIFKPPEIELPEGYKEKATEAINWLGGKIKSLNLQPEVSGKVKEALEESAAKSEWVTEGLYLSAERSKEANIRFSEFLQSKTLEKDYFGLSNIPYFKGVAQAGVRGATLWPVGFYELGKGAINLIQEPVETVGKAQVAVAGMGAAFMKRPVGFTLETIAEVGVSYGVLKLGVKGYQYVQTPKIVKQISFTVEKPITIGDKTITRAKTKALIKKPFRKPQIAEIQTVFIQQPTTQIFINQPTKATFGKYTFTAERIEQTFYEGAGISQVKISKLSGKPVSTSASITYAQPEVSTAYVKGLTEPLTTTYFKSTGLSLTKGAEGAGLFRATGGAVQLPGETATSRLFFGRSATEAAYLDYKQIGQIAKGSKFGSFTERMVSTERLLKAPRMQETWSIDFTKQIKQLQPDPSYLIKPGKIQKTPWPTEMIVTPDATLAGLQQGALKGALSPRLPRINPAPILFAETPTTFRTTEPLTPGLYGELVYGAEGKRRGLQAVSIKPVDIKDTFGPDYAQDFRTALLPATKTRGKKRYKEKRAGKAATASALGLKQSQKQRAAQKQALKQMQVSLQTQKTSTTTASALGLKQAQKQSLKLVFEPAITPTEPVQKPKPFFAISTTETKQPIIRKRKKKKRAKKKLKGLGILPPRATQLALTITEAKTGRRATNPRITLPRIKEYKRRVSARGPGFYWPTAEEIKEKRLKI